MSSVIQRWNKAVNCLAEKNSWFCSSFQTSPQLFVRGRVVPMPILNETFDALKAISSDAPFGKGSETVVDKTVRDAKQIDCTEITFDNSWHEDVLSKIVEEVGRAFNTEGLRAELYKMLLYEKGGHFTSHRDTLRASNHVASLLISLPVYGGCIGGELKVKGPGSESQTMMSWDGRCRGLQCSWAAFYTDCEHELLPLTEGRRVTLAYNLFAEPVVKEEEEESSVVEEEEEKSDPAGDLPVEAFAAMTSVIDDVLAFREYVLIALDHFYGMHVQPCFLKGRDRLVYEALHRLYGERAELKQVEALLSCNSWDGGDHSLGYGMWFLGKKNEAFFATDDLFYWVVKSLPRPYTDCIRKNEPDLLLPKKNAEQDQQSDSDRDEREDDWEYDDNDELGAERKAHFVSSKYAFFFDSTRIFRVSEHIQYEQASEYTGNESAPEQHQYRFTVLRIRRGQEEEGKVKQSC